MSKLRSFDRSPSHGGILEVESNIQAEPKPKPKPKLIPSSLKGRGRGLPGLTDFLEKIKRSVRVRAGQRHVRAVRSHRASKN
jgi:hypothetical protein